MALIIGSARIDENGNISGGKAGDNNGKEVSTQSFYVHSKGWNVLRAKNSAHADKLALAMATACANDNIGYDQNQREGVVKYGINSTVKTEADCSSLVRACITFATGKDVGNFTTYNEKSILTNSGLFDFVGKYTDSMKLRNGDILVTCSKGHTAIVVSGGESQSTSASYRAKVTTKTDPLNYRAEPNGGATKLGSFPKGTIVTVTKESNGWAFCDGKGWASMQYLTKVTETSGKQYKLSGNLYYREGAGTSFKALGTVKSGSIVTISKFSSNNWGYIEGKGWISLNTIYTKAV